MAITKRLFNNTLRIICGIVFICSGALKSIDSGAFGRLLESYNIPFLEYTAPIIIITEILLGIALLTGLWKKVVAVVSLIMVIVFTIGYTYGLTMLDISDCGCFGQSSFLSNSPATLYTRNIILIAVFSYLSKISPRPDFTNHTLIYQSKILLTITIGCIAAFICGNTFHQFHVNKQLNTSSITAISDSPLSEIITTTADSTYLIFAFSYQCPHCLNSIANLNQYEKHGVVDRVIAIGLGGPKSEAKFRTEFEPQFTLITDLRIMNLTNNFPKAYFVRNDSIVATYSGELPCAKVFKSRLESEINLQ